MNTELYNFLFIVTDDLSSYRRFLRHDKVWGHAPFGIKILLPGLEKLEARSCIFDRAYCAVPSCGHARATVMSGYSPADTGILSNDLDWTEELLPEQIWTYQIRQKGYRMETVGKIFYGFRAQPDGVYSVLYDSKPFRPIFKPNSPPILHGGMHGRGWDNADDKFYYHMVASTAANFPRIYKGTEPFWHKVGFHYPHMPFDNPNRIFESIDPNEIIMPSAWKLGWDLLPFTEASWSGNALGTHRADWTEEQQQYRRLTVRNYIANVKWLDEQLERVIDELDRSPFRDNTIIRFYSDHGYHLANKGHWLKFTLWEGACTAPFMISAPRLTPRFITSPISMMDLGPTCLDYAGAQPRSGHIGRSLRPIIEGRNLPDAPAPTMWFGSFSVAMGDYRLTLLQDGSAEMYDIVNYIWQQKNLAPHHPDFARMRDELLLLAESWGVQIVEEPVSPALGTPFVSYLGLKNDVEQTAQHFVAMDAIEVRARTPSYTKMFGAPENDDAAFELPPHVSEFHVMHKARIKTLKLRGNQLDNKVVLGRTFNTGIYIDFGEGNDENSPVEGWIHAMGGSGNDTLRSGPRRGILDGGPGDDVLYAGSGKVTLLAEAGNDILHGGDKHNVFHLGHGTCRIRCGAGANIIHLEGGSNTVVRANQTTKIVIQRTGHVQRIRGAATRIQ